MLLEISKITIEPIKQGKYIGEIAYHIYFAGCSCRCNGCFVNYEFPVHRISIPEIARNLSRKSKIIKKIVFTGGEPTEQILEPLIRRLERNEYQLILETNGVVQTNYSAFIYINVTPIYNNIPNEEYLRRAGEIRFPITYIKAIKEAVLFREQMESFTHPQAVWKLQPWISDNIDELDKKIFDACISFISKNLKWRIELPYTRGLIK